MVNLFKVLGSVFVVAIAAFTYVYGRGRRNKKRIVKYAKMDILSYEHLVDELKKFIEIIFFNLLQKSFLPMLADVNDCQQNKLAYMDYIQLVNLSDF